MVESSGVNAALTHPSSNATLFHSSRIVSQLLTTIGSFPASGLFLLVIQAILSSKLLATATKEVAVPEIPCSWHNLLSPCPKKVGVCR